MLGDSKAITINMIAVPLLAVVALTALCYFASPILVPLVTAVTLAYVLWPLVAFLKRIKVPHLVAVIIVMLLAILLLFFVGMLIYGEAKDFAVKLPGYWERFQELRSHWMTQYPEVSEWLVPAQAESIFNQIDVKQLTVVPQYLFRLTGGLFSFLGQATLILLLTLFMLVEQQGLTRRLRRAFGSDKEGATNQIVTEISQQIAGYIWVRAVTTIGLAIIFTVGLLILGVDYAYIWGPLAALLNLIPYIGAFIGAIPPMIVAAVGAGSFLPMLWVFIFFMAVQFVESNLVTPKLVGDQLNISLLAQLLATIFWGWLWGAIGIVLAVPITAALKVVCNNIDALKPIDILLSGDKN
ncbi:MAG: AI-2E family transporter [candidate division Zixibacteria bacterium]|nr:AI-2E family transporter [candidate division Zixibacteria bacterium]